MPRYLGSTYLGLYIGTYAMHGWHWHTDLSAR